MRRFLSAALLSCFIAYPAACQDAPLKLHSGALGRDWDAVAFDVGAGQSAAISVINTTKNEGSGNTAYIDIYVNGERQTGANADGHSFGQDAHRAKTTFIVRNPGHYVVEIDCTNRNADADSCAITGTGVPIVHIK